MALEAIAESGRQFGPAFLDGSTSFAGERFGGRDDLGELESWGQVRAHL
jgi:hypothetical protein